MPRELILESRSQENIDVGIVMVEMGSKDERWKGTFGLKRRTELYVGKI